MKKRSIILTALALLLVLGAAVGPALAYFSGTVHGEGRHALTLGHVTTIKEDIDQQNKVKILTVNNTGDSPVYVRARAFAPEGIGLSYAGDGWTRSGDWYVYGSPVPAGGSSAVLRVTVGPMPTEKDSPDFNVVVVYESTPVQYNADGSAKAPDWSMKLVNKGTA